MKCPKCGSDAQALYEVLGWEPFSRGPVMCAECASEYPDAILLEVRK